MSKPEPNKLTISLENMIENTKKLKKVVGMDHKVINKVSARLEEAWVWSHFLVKNAEPYGPSPSPEIEEDETPPPAYEPETVEPPTNTEPSDVPQEEFELSAVDTEPPEEQAEPELTKDEIIEEILALFALLQFNKYDETKAIKESTGAITLKRATKDKLIVLRDKLESISETTESGSEQKKT